MAWFDDNPNRIDHCIDDWNQYPCPTTTPRTTMNGSSSFDGCQCTCTTSRGTRRRSCTTRDGSAFERACRSHHLERPPLNQWPLSQCVIQRERHRQWLVAHLSRALLRTSKQLDYISLIARERDVGRSAILAHDRGIGIACKQLLDRLDLARPSCKVKRCLSESACPTINTKLSCYHNR